MPETGPETIGHYRVIARLSDEGTGVLFLAQDSASTRKVTVRWLKGVTSDASSGSLTQSLLRDALAMARFRHPNVIPTLDAGELEGAPYVVRAHVPGQSLGEMIAAQAAVSLKRRLDFVFALCDGLASAHEKLVVHGRVKPTNLIVHRETAELKLVDFGLAIVLDLTRDAGSGASYLAPEQATGGLTDERTDIFGVGLVLYELLCYKPAFSTGDSPGVRDQVLNQEPIPLRERQPTLSPDLIGVVARALSKDPAARYQTVTQLREALSQAAGRLNSTERYSTLFQPGSDQGRVGGITAIPASQQQPSGRAETNETSVTVRADGSQNRVRSEHESTEAVNDIETPRVE